MPTAHTFFSDDWVILIAKLSLSALMGGLIGRNRHRERKPAGVRTHALVCLGSTIFVMIPLQDPELITPSQVIQGVAQGIGFLGAGEIIQQSSRERQGEIKVIGLTSAAAIWSSAALGIAVGAGYYKIAFIGFLFIMLTLEFGSRLER
jgi:putative Mg2+ transporter-C (MgtC) family protein